MCVSPLLVGVAPLRERGGMAGIRGRRRGDGSGRRPFRVVIRLNADEMAKVQAMAEVQGVSVPKLYTEALFAGGAVAAAIWSTIRDELAGTRRLLAITANNVNQLARVANATGEIPRETASTLDALRRAAERLDALLADAEDARP